jgi:hypothetical protein
MKQGSRAHHKQRHRRFTSGPEAVSSRSGGELQAALSMAAESTSERTPDPPAAALVPVDRQDPPPSAIPERRRAARPHVEDDFFARGDEISVPPSSVDAHVEADEVVHRPIPPAVLARRARMRRIVGTGVAAAALLTSLVIVRAQFGRAATSHASDSSLSVQNRVVPSIALAAPPETTAPAVAQTAEVAAAEAPAPEAPEHRLPVIDVLTPAAPDAATDRVWEKAAKSLSAQDFNGADKALAELGHSNDIATRETARLARAVWWMSNGKQAEVRPVLADLAAHAATPYVQHLASELSRTN